MSNSIVQQIIETSRRIKDNRSRYAVLAKGMEEMGELSQEVAILEGDHYKPPGKDGVIGESVDVIVCMVDMIYSVKPDITDEEILDILKIKLSKWEASIPNRKPAQTTSNQNNKNGIYLYSLRKLWRQMSMWFRR